MDLWSGVVLGVFQGVFEWLPISSSAEGMLVMVGFLKASPQTAFSFSVFLHLGTLLAALVRFRRELLSMVGGVLSGGNSRLFWFITVATVFSMVGGFPAYFLLKGVFLESGGLWVTGLIGLLLVFTGLVLHYSRRKSGFGVKGVEDSNLLDSAIVGFVQGVAVLPGVSRSGVTTAALLLREFKQEHALELSFIMSIPAVIGLLGVEALQNGFMGLDLGVAVAGVLASFIVGYLMIDVLLGIARKIRFDLFCILFGLLAAGMSALPFLL